ncbi:MAG: hypothetical protein WAS55_14980 [Saprospiraceae bacterium]
MKNWIPLICIFINACAKDETFLDLTKSPPPSTFSYFEMKHQVDKKDNSSWEFKFNAREPGGFMFKSKMGYIYLISHIERDTSILFEGYGNIIIGDTIWFSRDLQNHPNPLHNYDYNRRDQVAIIQRLVDR